MTIRFTPVRSRASLALLLSAAVMSLAACVVEPARPPQPAPLVEVVPAAPAPGYHWVKGHYAWRAGRWEWIHGHWMPN
ncbi:YXWGXW repeat-containing protein [Trinickia acidisoli]|uniref:YXWGXW repeat-containing protein n=1 Tax=Trinickia acidisoli TaxID=2767482 RepID=UPI001A906D80|nr:YXWGXW repeat-containing protein [Trinickia acidisoli]